MKLLLASLSIAAVCSAVHGYTYGLGKSWVIGQGSTSSISKVTTTFNPGTPPSDQAGELILYPAMSNGTGDILMTSVESWSDQSWCGATLGQWCIRPQVFSDRQSNFGPFVPLDANTPVTFVFERNADKSGWTQSSIINGETVTQISWSSGPMTMFGVTTECDDFCAMTISQQTYTNTVIELEEADSSWNSTAVVGSQVYGDGTDNVTGQKPTAVTGMSISEGGRVWSVDQIMIPPLN
ncbi:uncharacterized protein FOMMEDRAFT_165774 [Fomitiporia mediterranea MF3/22]|uniref:uncharacterized protein n=1 Tax=Fomitiporia mediterranea (strain MF3/22) TaxID=694068 RepID=UPI000440914F|nr:uncharacterized protein FOMMEDRAFT_165774 [Fomitiporia mediterranea MF3/22]EJD05309.1 hypothetical protein FOMMEDRAFT_165774 [Fomitiporia mediterranea MF3/22]